MPIYWTSNRLFSENTLWNLFPGWMSQSTGTWVPDNLELDRGVPPPAVEPGWLPAGTTPPPTEPRIPRTPRTPRTPDTEEEKPSIPVTAILAAGLLFIAIMKK
jgi:hypothetical protein